jgi:N-acetylglucosamine kinase-like BadF-type ATPase
VALFVGIDAGQTGIRAALSDGTVGEQVPGVPRMEHDLGPDDVATALLAGVAGLGLAARGGEIAGIGIGLSGFELISTAEMERIATRMRARLDTRAPVAIATDGITSLLGALGSLRAGVVVAAGTGVVVLGHDGGDRWAHVDGWGSLLGDDGSGFAIGQAGLRAALRAHDGRDGSRPLLAAAEARFGPIAGLPAAILRDTTPTSRLVASFAPAVADAAHAGDVTARNIWTQAGENLAHSAVAALHRLFAPGIPADVALLGNVWNAGALLREPFERELIRRWPAATIVPAAGTSLDGAVVLAGEDSVGTVAGLAWRG